MDKNKSFTGHSRRLQTRWGVKLIDRLAASVITVAGIATIGAVMLVCVFLLWEAAPLFFAADIEAQSANPLANSQNPVQIACDEQGLLAWMLLQNGTMTTIRIDDGNVVESRKLFDQQITAWSFSIDRRHAAFGFADGTIRFGTIEFKPLFYDPQDLPEGFPAVDEGRTATFGNGVVTKTPEGQFRLLRVQPSFEDPVQSESTKPVELIDYVQSSRGPVFCVLNADGRLQLTTVRARTNLLTNKTTYKANSRQLPYTPSEDRGKPGHLLLTGLGDNVYVTWEDGFTQRYLVRGENAKLAEERDLVPSADALLTSLTFMVGRTTLIAGDSKGRVKVWFPARPKSGGEPRLVNARSYHFENAAVTALVPASRSRLLAAGHANGRVRLLQVTSSKNLGVAEAGTGEPVRKAALSAKEQTLLALTDESLLAWNVEPHSPEASFQSLWQRVWYEGHSQPEYVWQSTGGTDSFEPKLSLIPLIFGTIKATVYSMLIAVPLALLAALYTSEFLSPRMRGRVKPAIEMMASLPSVVLGFLAALVFAPVVERMVTAVLCGFVTLPLALLLGAYCWQTLPRGVTVRVGGYRVIVMAVFIGLGLLGASVLGPLVESLLFAGDVKQWLDGQQGSATGGWVFLLLPLCGVVVAFLVTRVLNPRLAGRLGAESRAAAATVDLVKFVLALSATVVLTYAVATLLTTMGFDPRGGVFDTYVQRNSLVVGVVMGFAVIPIIYTLADDALSAVPQHLRSASLGAGATHWQTAVRIIIPAAMSGLFSAVMIGLGRAVGETMIMLMATGNTPIMEWNVFNGFRTLSANLAVELLEAVKDSTHYRTLFLAALVLFAMTFVTNTLAEVVRLSFRKRAARL